MNPQQILGLQVLLSLVGWALLARWYVSPRLATRPREEALPPLLLPHAFRHMGLVFLLPTVVGGALPPAFARPAAYGDLAAGLLAVAAMLALRSRWSIAVPLTDSSAWRGSPIWPTPSTRASPTTCPSGPPTTSRAWWSRASSSRT